MTKLLRACYAPIAGLLIVCGASSATAQKAAVTSGPTDSVSAVVAPQPSGDHGVYINQVGQLQTAQVSQVNPNNYVAIRQQGAEGVTIVNQSGEGMGYLVLEQEGLLNDARVTQFAAPGGSNQAIVAQQGDENIVVLNQSAGVGDFNGAVLAQQGNGNQMSLTQNGAGNGAVLAQTGDNNAMTAVQNGNANQLQWIQNGSGLSDLRIIQGGGQSMSITQSNGGD